MENRRDHPRGCGEHSPLLGMFCTTWGSSPRMRGAHVVGGNVALDRRIIPADAGSTIMAIHSVAISWDHPRGCGEHAMKDGKVTFSQGSSPRMRGALLKNSVAVIGARIIPADAGSTKVRSHCVVFARDHPRGCGEHGRVDKFPV